MEEFQRNEVQVIFLNRELARTPEDELLGCAPKVRQ
jgi:hypothetical protein